MSLLKRLLRAASIDDPATLHTLGRELQRNGYTGPAKSTLPVPKPLTGDVAAMVAFAFNPDWLRVNPGDDIRLHGMTDLSTTWRLEAHDSRPSRVLTSEGSFKLLHKASIHNEDHVHVMSRPLDLPVPGTHMYYLAPGKWPGPPAIMDRMSFWLEAHPRADFDWMHTVFDLSQQKHRSLDERLTELWDVYDDHRSRDGLRQIDSVLATWASFIEEDLSGEKGEGLYDPDILFEVAAILHPHQDLYYLDSFLDSVRRGYERAGLGEEYLAIGDFIKWERAS